MDHKDEPMTCEQVANYRLSELDPRLKDGDVVTVNGMTGVVSDVKELATRGGYSFSFTISPYKEPYNVG